MREEEKEKEKEGKGFIVKDKRHFFQQEAEPARREEKKHKEPGADEARLRGEEREREAEKKEQKKDLREEGQRREVPLPEVTFSHFIFSLITQALIQLGEIQDPESKKTVKNLPLAKQNIDLIAMLREKTSGNLTKDEEALIDNALYDLRMRYVKASG